MLIRIEATVVPQRQVGDWGLASCGTLDHTDLQEIIVTAAMPARIIREMIAEG